MAKTVTGEIPVEQVGIILPHKHIFVTIKKYVIPSGNAPQIFYDKIKLEKRLDVALDSYGS